MFLRLGKNQRQVGDNYVNMLAYFLPGGAYWRKKDLKQALMYLILTAVLALVVYVFAWPKTGLSSSTVKRPSSSSRQGRPSLQNDGGEVDVCKVRDFAHLMGIKNCGAKYKELSKPSLGHNWVEYKIAIVADLDEEKSKVPDKKNHWRSFYREGILRKHFDGKYSVQWKSETITLTSKIAEKGRGLELSELAVFHNKLYSVDDRTGIVYQIKDRKVVPWVILPDGDGSVAKGFKGEWLTVKDNTLYVGGLGKEWTTPTGKLLNYNPQYVKSIGPSGDVVHHDWRGVYENVKTALNIKSPGYVIHEAVMWGHAKRRWYFLPRRASHETYDDQADERRATNVLISCNENFEDFKVTLIGKLIPTHGFSSFKFVPGTNDEIIVALKSVEDAGAISTYVMVFNINGNVIMDETFIDNDKYEGIEFV